MDIISSDKLPEQYSIDDINVEMGRRYVLQNKMETLDNHYLIAIAVLNRFLIQTEKGDVSPELIEEHKQYKADAFAGISDYMAEIKTIIENLEVSQIKYMKLLNEIEKTIDLL